MPLSRRDFLQKASLDADPMLLTDLRSSFALPPVQEGKMEVALADLSCYSKDLLAPALQETRHCRLAGIVAGTPAKAERSGLRSVTSPGRTFTPTKTSTALPKTRTLTSCTWCYDHASRTRFPQVTEWAKGKDYICL
jgi:hypothetical protein